MDKVDRSEMERRDIDIAKFISASDLEVLLCRPCGMHSRKHDAAIMVEACFDVVYESSSTTRPCRLSRS